MANIENVDYEALPKQASRIRNEAVELNNKLTAVYEKITNMHTVWYGKRYYSLVVEFNNIIPQLNELLNLVVGEIPFALETIANNYAQADKGANVTSAQKTAPKRIIDIPNPEDVGMRFKTVAVQNMKSQVSTNIDNAIAKMDSIESIYGQIQWQSEAADSFRSTFTRLKNQIVSSFNNIESQFTRLMSQAEQDIQSAESSNTLQ